MAKRGQVVDAETAEKIAEEFRQKFDPLLRPIIWPLSEADRAFNPEYYTFSLEGYPLHRPLAHLCCFDDFIMVIYSIPAPQSLFDGYYAVLVGSHVFDYDGNMTEEYGNTPEIAMFTNDDVTFRKIK